MRPREGGNVDDKRPDSAHSAMKSKPRQPQARRGGPILHALDAVGQDDGQRRGTGKSGCYAPRHAAPFSRLACLDRRAGLIAEITAYWSSYLELKFIRNALSRGRREVMTNAATILIRSKSPSPTAASAPCATPMHDFCRSADFRTRGIRRTKRLETKCDGMRFCFKAPGLAEAFQAGFGGDRLDSRSGGQPRREGGGEAAL
jgi:hypothetical protein